jgi:hypothetical protein
MNWLILILISLITNIVVFTICGAGGGFMMLVALNGFSERAATPILILFALIMLGVSIALSTATSWIYVKARKAESTIKFWNVVGVNAGVNVLIILTGLAVFSITRLFH